VERLDPHSQCSLRANPNFFQNFRSIDNTLRGNFGQRFLFGISHCDLDLKFKGYIFFIAQNCDYFKQENFQNLHQKNLSE
jgi:hypothetical protein